jgi:ribonuclease Z
MADYTGHTTALEAATIAQKAQVGKLILGHFSNRYGDLTVFTDEARTFSQFIPTKSFGKCKNLKEYVEV